MIEQSRSDAAPTRGRRDGEILDLRESSFAEERIVRLPDERHVPHRHQVEEPDKNNARLLLVQTEKPLEMLDAPSLPRRTLECLEERRGIITLDISNGLVHAV